MTDEQYKELENLIGLLAIETGKRFGCSNICIVNNYIQDGYFIGLYDGNGNLKDRLSGPTIKGAVDGSYKIPRI